MKESSNKTFAEQQQLLGKEEQVAPIVLTASALLCHKLQTNEDLVGTDFTRCREQFAIGDRVTLYWEESLLNVGYGYWDGARGADAWLSSVRTA